MTSFIRYQPADWGQPLKPKDPAGALGAVDRFLRECAGREVGSPEATLIVFEPGRYSPEGYDHEPTLVSAQRAFGEGARYAGVTYPDGGRDFKYEWKVSAEGFHEAVGLVAALPRWRGQYVLPVALSLRVTFALAPERWTGEAALDSSVHIYLCAASSAAFDLRFPFGGLNDDLCGNLADGRALLAREGGVEPLSLEHSEQAGWVRGSQGRSR